MHVELVFGVIRPGAEGSRGDIGLSVECALESVYLDSADRMSPDCHDDLGPRESVQPDEAGPVSGAGRRHEWLLKPGESPADWGSLGDLTDVGPFGWLIGTVVGLVGWVFHRRRGHRRTAQHSDHDADS